MKTRNLITCAAILAGLTACIPSLNPFYTEKDLRFDARLLGEWQEKGNTNEPTIWKFEESNTNEYKLTMTEKEGKEGKFSAHLFKLKNDDFLDLIPADCEMSPKQADIVAASMFPGHLLVKVTRSENTLKLAFFDFDKVANLLKENPSALAHNKENDRIVLTADTKALQKFVLKHVEDGLFGTPGEMIRKNQQAPKP